MKCAHPRILKHRRREDRHTTVSPVRLSVTAMTPQHDYATPSRFTSLTVEQVAAIGQFSSEPLEVIRPVAELVIQPRDAKRAGLTPDRIAEMNLRPAGALIDRLLDLDPRPLSIGRVAGSRVVGTCRHFAVLACALLRQRAVSARVRCGFATYFRPGLALDHWIVEYAAGGGWRRVDPEVLGGDVIDNADDLGPDQFLTGTEAWDAYRRHEVDASTFGVHGTDNFGAAEIRGNVVRDLAALNLVEMLPWDEWGQMTAAYDGRTTAAYDRLLDAVARAESRADIDELGVLFQRPDLHVPDDMLACRANGASTTVYVQDCT